MKAKIIISILLTTLMIGSVFGSATDLGIEKEQIEISPNSAVKEYVSPEDNCLIGGGALIGNGGWHDEETQYKYANQYYQKTDDWHTWSPHGMECDNYWDPADDDYLYFQFIIDDIPVKEESLKIGVEFKADGWPWNDGPDLEVKNVNTGQWYKRKQGMGKPGSLTWKWYAMTNSMNYISSSSVVKFRILCASGCHAWVDDVGIKYQSADEEIYDATAYTRDDNSDGAPDGVDIYIDADVGDYGDGTTVDVTAQGQLLDPDGDVIDTDSGTWTITDWETEYGILTLSALGGDNGQYTMQVTLYDENGNNEDYAEGTVNLEPDPQATVTFYTDPSNGGTITFNGNTYNNGQSTSVSYGTYSITANPATNYLFDYWSKTGSLSIGDPNSQSTTLIVSGDGTLSAHFYEDYYDIDFYTVPTNGGTITFNGNEWANGQSGQYPSGQYNILANPADEHYFDKWTCGGGVSVNDPNSQSTTATVSGDGWLKAHFVYDPTTYKITFYTDPTYVGAVRFDGTDYTNGESDNYPTGIYDINAIFDAEKFKFVKWIPSGGVSVDDIYAKKTKATVSGTGSLKAVFESISNLDCMGNLEWYDVSPGETVTGSFGIHNIGGPDSYLNWEITNWPSWGDWTFSQLSGTNLPSGEYVTIQVEVVAPNEKDTEFGGNIKAINSDDGEDYDTVSVYLKTPRNKAIQYFQAFYQFLQRVLDRFPKLMPILRQVLIR